MERDENRCDQCHITPGKVIETAFWAAQIRPQTADVRISRRGLLAQVERHDRECGRVAV